MKLRSFVTILLAGSMAAPSLAARSHDKVAALENPVPVSSVKNITGFGIDVKALMDGKEVVALNVNTTDKNTTFGLNMTAEDLFTFNANGSVNLEKTTEEISKAPNGNVVNLNNVIPKLISE